MQELQQFIPAKLHEGKIWYISFYAFNPEKKALSRKRIKINRIKSVKERRKYARDLINRINVKLYSGWNPFIDPETSKSYHKLSDALNHFWKVSEKKMADDVIREETYRNYISYPRNMQKWLNDTRKGDIYIYKLDKQLINEFLEHIYIERDSAAITRNNYLAVLRVFATFLIDHNYLKHKFTDGISNLKKGSKKRKSLLSSDLLKLRNYLNETNRHYLLACEMEYYTFIRPKELSELRINQINFAKGTILVTEQTAKNRKNAVVSIPKRLGRLLIDLKIYQYPSDNYLFSENFKPGTIKKSEKQFRDYWLKVRKTLKFPETYQFYSLKDTGITDMIHMVGDPLIVRDQARHHSISITNLYADGDLQMANQMISNLDY